MPSRLKQHPAEQISRLARDLDESADRLLRLALISLMEWRVLQAVRLRPLTQVAVAAKIGVSPALVSRLTASLRRKALVSVTRSAKDRRAVVLELTLKGRQTARAGARLITINHRPIFGRLSKTEQAELSRLLDLLCQSMEGGPG